MIPTVLVSVSNLPLRADGDVDRDALARSDLDAHEPSPEIAAPQNPTEELLVRLWIEALGVEVKSVHADFFALGGHSLLAMQLIAQIHDMTRVTLSIRTFFEKPTIAELAQHVLALQAGLPGSADHPDLQYEAGAV
jgi:acyl carrier protein